MPVRRAKMGERDGRVAVVTSVPMEECPACGERWLALETAEMLDDMLRRLIDSGAERMSGPLQRGRSAGPRARRDRSGSLVGSDHASCRHA
ncbi:MAG: YgiT-type zinc finger protein [Actinobacteria bacterium]|nr:YgiT-type zinc finger protein [Actinomycetota bacterium]